MEQDIPIAWRLQKVQDLHYAYDVRQKAFLAYGDTRDEAIRLAKMRLGLLAVAS